LDMMKGSWMSGVAKMSMARAACAAAGINSRVYAIGGSSDGRRLLSSAECYAENTNSWVQIAPMTCPRGAFAAVSLHGYIYTLGGLNAQQTLNNVERFDPQSNEWEQLPSMSSPRAELAACAVAGRVFAIGGFNDKGFLLGTVEAYEPRICCWESMPALPQPVAACAAVVSKGHIYSSGARMADARSPPCSTSCSGKATGAWGRRCGAPACPSPPELASWATGRAATSPAARARCPQASSPRWARGGTLAT
jgi:hypothetical protein